MRKLYVFGGIVVLVAGLAAIGWRDRVVLNADRERRDECDRGRRELAQLAFEMKSLRQKLDKLPPGSAPRVVALIDERLAGYRTLLETTAARYRRRPQTWLLLMPPDVEGMDGDLAGFRALADDMRSWLAKQR